MKNNLEILKNFGAIAEELKSNPTPDAYWIQEEKESRQRMEQNKKLQQSISMSNKKFHQPFSL